MRNRTYKRGFMSLKSTLLTSCLLTVFISINSHAGDLEWSGNYRFEAQSIENPEMVSGNKKAKEYGVHHLILRPRIVASDGLYINSQFHILNSSVGGPQLGSVWGSGLANTAGAADYSAANGQRNKEESFAVSEFYVTLAQEYGSLIVGRAPLQFGLGMTYNAGKGAFDHYYDNRDLVGYKVVMGNFFILPMLAKLKEADIGGYDDVSETLVQLQYESPESNTAMGFMYVARRAGSAGNDMPVDAGSQFGPATPYGTATISGNLDFKTMNIFYTKTWEHDRVGFEIVNQTGDYGVANGSGNGISQNAYALAFEYEHDSESKTNWGIKAGWASGDDESTIDEYEGYAFDRNYDVAALMFNHSFGRRNFLRTQSLGTRFNTTRNTTAGVNSPLDDPDSDAISNVMYFAPYVTYEWSDDIDLKAVLATGSLDQDVYGGQTADTDLGYEIDLSLIYSPSERLTWESTFAYYTPGKAFDIDGDTGAAYGLISRATISF